MYTYSIKLQDKLQLLTILVTQLLTRLVAQHSNLLFGVLLDGSNVRLKKIYICIYTYIHISI